MPTQNHANSTFTQAGNQLSVMIPGDGIDMKKESRTKSRGHRLTIGRECIFIPEDRIRIENVQLQGALIHASMPLDSMAFPESSTNSPTAHP